MSPSGQGPRRGPTRRVTSLTFGSSKDPGKGEVGVEGWGVVGVRHWSGVRNVWGGCDRPVSVYLPPSGPSEVLPLIGRVDGSVRMLSVSPNTPEPKSLEDP